MPPFMRLFHRSVLALFVAHVTSALADTAEAVFSQKLVAAAVARTHQAITYDGAYHAIPYPNGDVPQDIGVCTDVIIRSYRALGIDLQEKLHEDIAQNFDEYPSSRIWGLTKPDTNIDHRRVPNLRVYFTRHGESLRPGNTPEKYKPGDIVTWMLPRNLPHIGIVIEQKSRTGTPLVVHNIGAGPVVEDMLFSYPITGHYRYPAR